MHLPLVDNSLVVDSPLPGIYSGVETFGRFIARLRRARGLTQEQLAERSGLSAASIRRGEASETCPWRPSAARDVLVALEGPREKPTPLSEADHTAYIEFTGLAAIIRAVDEVQQRDRAPLRALAESTAATLDLLNPEGSKNPETQTAHMYVARLLDEIGPTKVNTMLLSFAAACGIDLPPAIRNDDIETRPRWLKFEPPPRDGLKVTFHEPVNPPQKPNPKPGRKAE